MVNNETKHLTGDELKAAQKEEAIARMRMLKLHQNAVNEFEKENKLNQSEYGGILYWLDETSQKAVNTFEESHSGIVYHVIKSVTDFGELLTMLYVSANTEEWEQDRNDLKDEGYAIAYVENLSDPMCSEMGGVVVQPRFGGVCRLY